MLFIKKFFEWVGLLKLSLVSYCLLFALCVVSFYFECYLMSTYFLVAAVYLTFFSKILPCEKDEALRLQKLIDQADYEKITFNKTFIITVPVISGIGIFYGSLIAKLYLFILLVMIITRFLGFKITTLFPFGINLLKNIKKDLIVLKYHWYTNLKNLRYINHINIVTLVVSFILGSLFTGSFFRKKASI